MKHLSEFQQWFKTTKPSEANDMRQKPYPLGVEIFDNAVQDTDQILEWLDTVEFGRSTVNNLASGHEGYADKRTSSTAFVPFISYKLPACVSEMNRTVFNHLDEYATRWNFYFVTVEDVSIQRYEPGQFFSMHTDAGSMNNRIVSALVYLNDVDGGETYFPHIDLAIQPKAGRLAIFPSNYIYAHEAKPPRSGMKYAAAYWAQG